MRQPSHKLFLLIDRRLNKSQQAVQACHAAIEFSRKFPDWKHQSLVLLAVNGETELEEWLLKLKDFDTATFREPYWDNRLTAIACHGCDEIIKELALI